MHSVEVVEYQSAAVLIPTPVGIDIAWLQKKGAEDEAISVVGRKGDVIEALRIIASGCEEALSSLGATR